HPIVRSLDAALALGPAIAIVANPTALHVPTALAALRAGAHVFIEKPVSHTLEGLDTLAAEAEARRRHILVGHQFRFHPTLLLLRDWIAADLIGRPIAADVRWGEYLPNWHPDEDYRAGYSAQRALGGGATLTLSHPFDYLEWMLGPVASVTAM